MTYAANLSMTERKARAFDALAESFADNRMDLVLPADNDEGFVELEGGGNLLAAVERALAESGNTVFESSRVFGHRTTALLLDSVRDRAAAWGGRFGASNVRYTHEAQPRPTGDFPLHYGRFSRELCVAWQQRYGLHLAALTHAELTKALAVAAPLYFSGPWAKRSSLADNTYLGVSEAGPVTSDGRWVYFVTRDTRVPNGCGYGTFYHVRVLDRKANDGDGLVRPLSGEMCDSANPDFRHATRAKAFAACARLAAENPCRDRD